MLRNEPNERKLKDSKILLVPEDMNKFPGLSPVTNTRRKQSATRKSSEASRGKKLVTFNKTDLIFESEPASWRNGFKSSEFENSLLNVVKEINEKDSSSCEGSTVSSELLEIDGKKDLMVEQDGEQDWTQSTFNEEESVQKDDKNFVNGFNQSEPRCRKKGEMRFGNDFLKEVINESDETNEIELNPIGNGSYLVTSKVDVHHRSDYDCNDLNDFNDSRDFNNHDHHEDDSSDKGSTDVEFDGNILRDYSTNLKTDKKSYTWNVSLDGHLNEYSSSSNHLIKNTEMMINRKLNGINLEDESDEIYDASKKHHGYCICCHDIDMVTANSRVFYPSSLHESTCGNAEEETMNYFRFETEDNEFNTRFATNGSSSLGYTESRDSFRSQDNVDRGIKFSEPRFDSEASMEWKQRDLRDQEVAVSLDTLYDAQDEVLLVCLPDEPLSNDVRKGKIPNMRLPFNDSIESERDRSDSGLPMSPCDGELIMKRMNRKKKYET